MTPKRKQIEQGLTRLELWLRKDTLMLDAMRMHFPGDAIKMMEFRDVVLNKAGGERKRYAVHSSIRRCSLR